MNPSQYLHHHHHHHHGWYMNIMLICMCLLLHISYVMSKNYTYYVDGIHGDNQHSGTQWSQAKRTIEDAIRVARVYGKILDNNVTIVIRAHTYMITNTRINYGVHLISEYNDCRTTIIDCHHEYSAFSIESKRTVRITGMTFRHCGVPEGNQGETNQGGALVVSGIDTVAELTNVLFFKNTAKSGGAVLVSLASLIMNDVQFVQNTAYMGAGVQSFGGAVDMHQVAFSGNYGFSGGALEAISTRVSIRNCRFQQQYVSSDGAALKVSLSTLSVSDTLFDGNVADHQAAAAKISRTSFDFDNCTFSNNTAASSGGAIVVDFGWETDPPSLWTMRNSVFRDNHDGSRGSAVHVTNGGRLLIQDSEFHDNLGGDADGSTASVAKDSYLYLESCNIHHNTSPVSGGALACITGAYLSISKCNFTSNRATNNGGAVTCRDSSRLFVNQSSFRNNLATFGSGGAVACECKECHTYGSTFIGNVAMTGGAFIQHDFPLSSITGNTLFANNTAWMSGGAIECSSEGKDLVLNDVTFEYNHAGTRGGAVFYETNSPSTCVRCNTRGNQAAIAGNDWTTVLSKVVFVGSQTMSIDAGSAFRVEVGTVDGFGVFVPPAYDRTIMFYVDNDAKIIPKMLMINTAKAFFSLELQTKHLGVQHKLKAVLGGFKPAFTTLNVRECSEYEFFETNANGFVVCKSPNIDYLSRSLLIGMWIVISIAMLVVVVFFILVYYHRRTAVMKAASTIFLFTMLFGCFLAFVGVFLQGTLDSRFLNGGREPPVRGEKADDLHQSYSRLCRAGLWMYVMGFDLAVGSLVVKTWRIHKIFNGINNLGRLKSERISNRMLMVRLGGALVFDAILLVVWQLIDPLKYEIYENDSVYEESCGCANFFINFILFNWPKSLLICYGLYLACKIRDVRISQFNESRQITFAVYNVIVMCIVVTPMMATLTRKSQTYIALCVLVSVLTLSMLGVVLVPKLYLIHTQAKARRIVEDSEREAVMSPVSMHRPASFTRKSGYTSLSSQQ